MVVASPAATPLGSWQPGFGTPAVVHVAFLGGVVPARPRAAVGRLGFASLAKTIRRGSAVSVRRPAGARDESRVARLGETAANRYGTVVGGCADRPRRSELPRQSLTGTTRHHWESDAARSDDVCACASSSMSSVVNRTSSPFTDVPWQGARSWRGVHRWRATGFQSLQSAGIGGSGFTSYSRR